MIVALCILVVCGFSAAAPYPAPAAPLEFGSRIRLFRDLSNVPVNVSHLAHRGNLAGDAWSSSSSGSSSSPQSGSSSSSSSPCSGSSCSCSGSSCKSSGGNSASPSNGDIYETNRQYYMVIKAGSANLAVLMDTGSNSLVIDSNSYNGGADYTWSYTGLLCKETYGSKKNTYSGYIYNAPVTVDGYAAQVAICLGTPSLGGFKGSGIMGLNLNPSNPNSAYAQTGSNVLSGVGWTSFGIYLSQAKGDGELTANGYNSAYFASGAQWTYEPLVSTDGKWTVGFTGFSIGTASGTPAVQQGTVDTGSSSFILDQASIDIIYSQLDFTGFSAPDIDCSQRGAAPPLVLTLGSGAQYSIPSTNYIEQIPSGGCRVALRPRPAGKPMNLGFPLTSTYYALFDVQNQQIGFIQSIG